MSRAIVTDSAAFCDQVASAIRAIPKRTPSAAFQAVLFYTDDSNRIRVAAGGPTGFVDRDVIGARPLDLEPVCLAIDAGRFLSAARSFRLDDWTIEPNPQDPGAVLASGRTRFTLGGVTPEAHPLHPDQRQAGGSASPVYRAGFPFADTLIQAGLRAATATDPKAYRYALAGVLIDRDDSGEEFHVVGTDGARLVRDRVATGGPVADWVDPERPVVVEPGLFRLAAGVVPPDGPLELTTDGTSFVELQSLGNLVRAGLVEGRFAPWRAVLEKAAGTPVLAITDDEDRGRLVEAVRLAAITCDRSMQRDALLVEIAGDDRQHWVRFRNRAERGESLVTFAATAAGPATRPAALVISADALLWGLEQIGGPFWWETDGVHSRFSTPDGGRDVLVGGYTDPGYSGIGEQDPKSLGLGLPADAEPVEVS